MKKNSNILRLIAKINFMCTGGLKAIYQISTFILTCNTTEKKIAIYQISAVCSVIIIRYAFHPKTDWQQRILVLSNWHWKF